MRADELLIKRQRSSQSRFFRALAGGARTSRLLEIGGAVEATIAPVRPWYSIFNSVLYRDGEQLLAALPHLAEAYEAAGSKAWTVWVPPGDSEIGEQLAEHGHALDSTPMLMGAAIGDLELRQQVALELDSAPTALAVADINDRAHGIWPEWSMTAVFDTFADPSVRPYVALDGEEPVSALLALEHRGDCYFWFVATAPEARGQGLASELVRHALREARRRGCTTTTLESTAMAESVYERLGFHALGRYAMWERREH